METITVIAHGGYTTDGRYVDTPRENRITGCVVCPTSAALLDGKADIVTGETTRLDIYAPPGTIIRQGDVVVVRGEVYEVIVTPWDYSYHRRPWNRMHTPGVRCVVERRHG